MSIHKAVAMLQRSIITDTKLLKNTKEAFGISEEHYKIASYVQADDMTIAISALERVQRKLDAYAKTLPLEENAEEEGCGCC